MNSDLIERVARALWATECCEADVVTVDQYYDEAKAAIEEVAKWLENMEGDSVHTAFSYINAARKLREQTQ